MSTVRAGKFGERIAIAILKKKGYKILDTNFHSRFGEIDIVAEDRGTLVFVEVKTRWGKKFGLPEEAVTPWKLRAIAKTGDYYKITHPKTPDLMRIDVVALEIEEDKLIKARIIKNAAS